MNTAFRVEGTLSNITAYFAVLRYQGIPVLISVKLDWKCSRSIIALYQSRSSVLGYKTTKRILIRDRDIAVAKLLATDVEFYESPYQRIRRFSS